jgi:hypothetical protein
MADAAQQGPLGFSHMSAVPVVAGFACRDTVYLRDCSGEVNLEKNVLPEDPLGARCDLLCSSIFAWLQPGHDSG